VNTAVRASNAFGVDLYQQIKREPGNLAFSPSSISLALAMTYAGAKGDTAAQMRTTMHLPEDAAALHGSWATVLSQWASPKDVEIAVVNRLFGDKDYTFEAPFLELTKSRYGAPLEKLDFAGAPEAQRQHINGWVMRQTRNRIENLIPEEGVSKDTRIALVNAIYFKAQWRKPFTETATKDAPFTTHKGTDITVAMMVSNESYRYFDDGKAQFIELPYKGGRFAMTIALPKDKAGLSGLEERVTSASLSDWHRAMSSERVALELPRFKIDPPAGFELSAQLRAMGMTVPFKGGVADFRAMADPPNPADRLFIQKVFHKAFIAVDEKGTEAAAATAVIMDRAGGPPQKPVEMVADHPFMYFIRDIKSGLVMFAGRVHDPS